MADLRIARGMPVRNGRPLLRLVLLAAAGLAMAPAAFADDAATWLSRAAAAARQQNFVGTVVYQRGGQAELSRLVHLNDLGQEFEKLVSLDGPAREVIRSQGEVRCYFPEFKVVRVEPPTFRNAFPSLSAQQQKALAEHYEFRPAGAARVAGVDAQAWEFEPKDGLRYGHRFWADPGTGLLLRAHVIDERGVVVEQVAFIDIAIGAKITRDMVRPTWPPAPPDWRVHQPGRGDVDQRDTGWTAGWLPPGFAKIVEGFRRMRGAGEVAHLVYSDGLVAISVFVEPAGRGRHQLGRYAQGGTNVFVRLTDENVVTVLGEAPPVTVRQIAYSVARR